jgi:hypothetical protein
MYPLISMAISNDSKVAITVSKASEKLCYIKFYDLETQNQVFVE